MNLKNNSFNYAKKYKSICKYLAIALPLLLLLIACIFPIKQINNTYALVETTTTNDSETYNLKQIFNYQNYCAIGNSNFNGTIDSQLMVNYIKPTNSERYVWLSIAENTELLANHTYLVLRGNNYGYGSEYLARYNNNNNALYYNGLGLVLNGYSERYSLIVPTENISLRFIDYHSNDGVSIISYIQVFDITDMSLTGSNSDIYNTFRGLYQNNTYPLFDKDFTNDVLTITNNIGNNAEQPLQSNETKQPNENILQPLNLLYKANINSWYDSFLTAFQLNYEDNNYMYYLVHYPLYILYVVLLDLLLDIILLVPCLLHRLVQKYKGDD